ncbi:SUMF1/EgtB/PvdO family nonheme iron enzyme [Microcoleus sp. Pol11C2]|uniref:SUMF1/EgtB/PvdO family nonheme iron enzyme n=1 Tax=Microcoleus sp. Pol11C2 TaxID=3055389 RepID=UPI002FD20144
MTESNNNLRVLRGGYWLNAPRDCRSTYSYNWDSDDRVNHLGFRIVCPIVWSS